MELQNNLAKSVLDVKCYVIFYSVIYIIFKKSKEQLQYFKILK